MEFLAYIPVPILLVIGIAANVGSGVINRYYTKAVSRGMGGFYLFLLITSYVSAVCIWGVTGFDLKMSAYSVITALIQGVVMALSAAFVLYSIAVGPWAYTTVITSFSMLIPTLIGTVFWHEQIDALTVIGIVLVAVSIVLSVQKGKKHNESAEPPQDESKKYKSGVSAKWFAAVIVATVATGGMGVIQKVHQKSDYRAELLPMLAISFAVMGTVFAILLVIYFIKFGSGSLLENPPQTRGAKVLLVMLIVVAGLCGMIKNIVNMYLSGVMNSAVFFPLSNGGNLVIVTLLAIFAYKEKLTVKQWIGLGAGIVAVVFLCL